jgi:cellulose biosynthesis protein BcsQ
MKTVAFFNNKGGVGKTSLVYHLAWMYAELGLEVIAADLDPQANLTSMFLDEEELENIWNIGKHSRTVFGAIRPLLEGTGDIAMPYVEAVGPRVGLLIGDLALSRSEEELNSQWPACLDRKPRAFRVMSALWRVVKSAAEKRVADVVLIDVGPNLGALNRAVLIASEYVAIPLAPDLYSLQGLQNLGPTLRQWRAEWGERRGRNPLPDLSIPPGGMQPAGYVVLQHAVRLDRPVKACDRWMSRIPKVYHESVLDETSGGLPDSIEQDSDCLAMLKHYRSLMPLAQEARKPMFFLRSADGAIGAHAKAVQECYRDFRSLARTIAQRCGLGISAV